MIHDIILNWTKIHGSVFTIWLGNKPVVILGTLESMNEAYKTKKFDFDRYHIQLSEVLLHSPSSVDVIVSRSSEKWDYLRKITHKASNKFAISTSLPNIVIPIVDQMISDIESDISKPFHPHEKFSTLVYCILGSFISGQTMSINDKKISDIMKSFLVQVGIAHKLVFIEYLPILRKTIFRKDWNMLISAYRYVSDWCYDRITDRLKLYSNQNTNIDINDDHIKSFCDELIKQKTEASKYDPKYDDFIDMDNMTNVAMNMFIAGSNSTSITLSWMLLYMCKYPDIQNKLRNEIYQNIGDDETPNIDHMKVCSYNMALISEIIRLCPVLPISLPHITTKDTQISGKDIPKDTMIIQSLIHAQRDVDLWARPEIFDPERFIDKDTGLYNKNREGYIAFSMGHRLCIGERLAYANLFVIMTRILQKTKGYMFVVNDIDRIDTDPDPEYFEYKPKHFEVRLQTVFE